MWGGQGGGQEIDNIRKKSFSCVPSFNCSALAKFNTIIGLNTTTTNFSTRPSHSRRLKLGIQLQENLNKYNL